MKDIFGKVKKKYLVSALFQKLWVLVLIFYFLNSIGTRVRNIRYKKNITFKYMLMLCSLHCQKVISINLTNEYHFSRDLIGKKVTIHP